MALTKKDFEAIAGILKTERERIWTQSTGDDRAAALDVLDRVTIKTARYCATQNPRFDQAKFIEATGKDA